MSDYKTALDYVTLRSNLRGEVRAMLSDDAILIRLLAAQQRYQSACAAGADAEQVIDDTLAELETWLRGAEQLEQIAAERQYISEETRQRTRDLRDERVVIDGIPVPF